MLKGNPFKRIICSVGIGFVLTSFVMLCSYAEVHTSVKDTTAHQDSITQIVAQAFSEGSYKKALQIIEGADSVIPSTKLLFYQSISYAALYNYPKALECFKKLVLQDSTNVNYRFQYGRFLLQAGFTDESIEQLKTCVAVDSSYLPASFQLGFIYNLQKKDPEKEVEVFSFLIRQNPDDFLSLYYKGDALRKLGMADSGIVLVEKSVELNPQYFPSLIALANDKYLKKEYSLALEYYQKALAIRPNDKDVIFQIGECYRKMGMLREAIEKFNDAIARDTLNATYVAQLGYAYFSLERYDSSIAAYNKAISIDDNNVQYYLNLAKVFQKLDSMEGMIESYHRGITALHPEQIAYIYNDIAAFYVSKNRWRDAAKAYEQSAVYDQTNDLALYWIGFSYLQIEENKWAKAAFQKYLRVTEGDSTKGNNRRTVQYYLENMKEKKK